MDADLIKKLVQEARDILIQKPEKSEDDEVLREIEQFILYDSRTKSKSFHEKKEIVDKIYNSVRKELDILQPLADDGNVNEIMVNGIHNVFIEREGRIEKVDVEFDSVEHLEEIIRRVVSKVHREISELNPIVDARLSDGSRINAVYKNVAIDGPILTIRKFPKTQITMEGLIEYGSITEEAALFLKQLVESGYNIFISGGTSSGKTTFLNVLSGYIPKDERIIVIEDSMELQISDIANIVRLEAKNANVQGKGEVTIRNLIKSALRMRPDRIIIGEVRGGEVLDMIQAMNTGHDGSLSTGHANSPSGMISRLETMLITASDFPIEAVRGQISTAIEIIVHLGRLRDKGRMVLEIAELEGYDGSRAVLNSLFKYIPSRDGQGRLEKTDHSLKNTEKLSMLGGLI